MRVEAASSTTYSDTSESSDKRIKRYLDHPKYRYKLTCLIHGHGNSSDQCKVLVDFGSKYSKSRPTKDCGHETEAKKEIAYRKIIMI